MAEIDTLMMSTQHSDIRREIADSKDVLNDAIRIEGGNTRFHGAANTTEIIKEGLKESFAARGDIKDTRYDVASRIADTTANLTAQIDRTNDSTTDRFFTVARDTADLRAQVIQAIDTTKMVGELNTLKGIIEGQKNTTYLGDKITSDGDRTRSLINDLKYHDLSRALVERNSELVEERHGRRHWRGVADQNQFGSQFAQLQSMMQNFNSQLADTRQGMVNFGTMSGQSGQQTSTANNVR